MSIRDDANIECPYQRVGMGSLVCRAAEITKGKDATNEVSEEVCYRCEAGKIFREIGCDQFSPKTWILQHAGMGAKDIIHFEVERIFCNRRKRETTYEYCKECTLVTSPATERIYKSALDYFESEGFSQTSKFLKSARKELTTNNDPDACIRASSSSLESTLKMILDKLEKPYPSKQQLTDLWAAVKKEIDLGDEQSIQQMKQMIGSLSGSVSALAGMRNSLSDAHGKGMISQEAYESYAELAMNISATLSTFLIRRLGEASK